jgi:outer membrane protein assembly factor BamA
VSARLLCLLLAFAAAVMPSRPAFAQSSATKPAEVVADVRVHGNQIVSDEDVLKIAGVTIGAPYSDALLAEITKRLKDSGKFESIDVLKRFASIEDASRIIVVIIVNEGPVRIVMPSDPAGAPVVKRRGFPNNLMIVPVLEGQDGYGLTYGARVAYPKPIGGNSRVSFPMTWGGTKRIAIELDRTFARGPFSRIEFGTGVQRRQNPAYDESDDRVRGWTRVLRVMGPFRAGGSTSWQKVSFGFTNDTFVTAGAELTFDTRENPVLPRNAVLVTASADHMWFESGGELTRMRIDANGYIGIGGQHVLVLHALGEAANAAEPLYLRSIMGGFSTVRGFETGFLTGDKMAAASIEWRIPVKSPLRFAKLGVTAFADAGTAYDYGQSFKQQPIYKGVGGTGWISIASFRLSMAVGYGIGSGTRVHVSGGIGF